MSLVDRKNVEKENVQKRNIESTINAASAHTIHV
jgi:hypothetical protein